MELNALLIHPKKDNVAVVFEDIAPGAAVALKQGGRLVQLQAAEAIPIYHKIALADLAPGQAVYKYGEIIGYTTRAVPRGSHLHDHNLTSRLKTGN